MEDGTELKVLSDLRAAIEYETVKWLDARAAIGATRQYILPVIHQRVPVGDRHARIELFGGQTASAPSQPAIRLGYRSFTAIEAEHAHEGPIEVWLGHAWLIRVFAEWDENAREALATLRGVKKNTIGADLFGDLRLYRNDIVHHHGMASRRHAGKAKMLRWAEPGETIIVNQARIMEVLLGIPWAEISPSTDPSLVEFGIQKPDAP